jgi:hypothetical protein
MNEPLKTDFNFFKFLRVEICTSNKKYVKFLCFLLFIGVIED